MHDDPISRIIDVLLVVALFAGQAVVALGGLQPLTG